MNRKDLKNNPGFVDKVVHVNIDLRSNGLHVVGNCLAGLMRTMKPFGFIEIISFDFQTSRSFQITFQGH